ncbi:MAG: hypothetical protein KDC95_02240 [Planctomycetes bacterium]|nr:hypothetical protein [Planctomycetota bacterium]
MSTLSLVPRSTSAPKEVFLHGIGRFGFVLLKELGDRQPAGWHLRAYDTDAELVRCLRWERRHSHLHPDVRIHDRVEIAADCSAIGRSDVLILAMPSEEVHSVLDDIEAHWTHPVVIVSSTCAVDAASGRLLSDIVTERLGDKLRGYAVLAGETLARDLVSSDPFMATISSADPEILYELRSLFASDRIILNSEDDVVSTEFACAATHVLALLAGCAHGAGIGTTVLARLIIRAAAQLQELGVEHFGARSESFSMASAVWGASIWMTASGHGEDREVGLLLGRGFTAADVRSTMRNLRRSCEGLRSLDGFAAIPGFSECTLLRCLHEFVKERIGVDAFLDEFRRIR